MRITVAALCLCTLAGLAPAPVQAQERFDEDKARLIAALLTVKASAIDDAAIKTDVDSSKPYGIHHGEHGVMVIPQKGLTAEAIAKAGKDVVPVGQMWANLLAPAVEGKRVDRDRLRFITLPLQDDEERTLSLYYLGVKADDDKKPVLVVYSKGVDPLLTVPLSAVDVGNQMPIDLKGERHGDDGGELTLTLLGKYRGVIRLKGLDD